MAELVFDVGAGKEDFIFMPACCYAGNQFINVKEKQDCNICIKAFTNNR